MKYKGAYKKNKKRYDIDKLVNPKCKYSAYILGLLWADGNIYKTNSKITQLNCIEEDMKIYKSYFYKVSNSWLISGPYKKYYKGKEVKPQKVIRMCSMDLYDFLHKHNYNNKSNYPKIVNKIPKNNHNFFILGLFDGDGHFNVVKKTKQAEWVITSEYSQNWKFLKDFCDDNNIEYSIYRLEVPLGKVSRFIIRKLKSLNRLLNIVHLNNDFGLPRKQEKINGFIELRNGSINSKHPRWSEEEISILKNNYKSKDKKINDNINRTNEASYYKIGWLKSRGLL